MEKHSYKTINLDVYEEVLDNGLRVYISKIPRNNIHARMTTFFGGGILNYKVDGKTYKVPAGIAHFLEHKMFEKEDDIDPMLVYEKNGAISNAYTNKFVTAYYFTGANYFYENLENLLNTIHKPYFTDENVQKEKGIILQEKKQSLDRPYTIAYNECLLNTFYNSDYKNTVLGSLDDINSITKEQLYDCYNAFYHPSNMMLTISGDVDPFKTMKFIKKYYSNMVFLDRPNIEILKASEPKEVVKDKEVLIKKDFSAKYIYINYKIKNNHFFEDDYLNRLYFSIFIDMGFGNLSSIVDVLDNDDNMLSTLSATMEELDGYFIASFFCKVKNNTDVIDLIDKTIKSTDFSEESFNLIKKVTLNQILLSTEDTKSACDLIQNQVLLLKAPVYDMYEKLQKLDFNTFKDYVKNLDVTNRSYVVLQNKN